MRLGLRGLSGGSSLVQLLAQERGVVVAEAAADAYRAGSFRWATKPAAPLVVRRYDADHYKAAAEGLWAIAATPTAALHALAARLASKPEGES